MNEIDSWLRQSPEFEDFQVLTTADEIAIVVPSVDSADLLWRTMDWTQHPPKVGGKDVVIWANGRLFADSSSVKIRSNPDSLDQF